MTDGTKAVVWNAVWLPWGGVHAITGAASLDARLPGQWYQLETGLHYNWHRHYDPSLGRYTQPDPLGFVDGPGVYGYAGGSPHVFVDPTGEFIPAVVVARIVVGAAFGIALDYGIQKLTTGCFNFGWSTAISAGLGAVGPAWSAWRGAQAARAATGATSAARGGENAAIPVGSSRSPMHVPGPQNVPTTIGGRQYTGHALDRMQGRGITPSVVEETIARGIRSPGRDGAAIFTTEQARVIMNPNGSIKTVYGR